MLSGFLSFYLWSCGGEEGGKWVSFRCTGGGLLGSGVLFMGPRIGVNGTTGQSIGRE